MNVKILFAYMKECEEREIYPTWEGLKRYKETGMIEEVEPFKFDDTTIKPVVYKREKKVFAPVTNKLNVKVMAEYCKMCERLGIEPSWDDAIKLNNKVHPPKAMII